MPAHGAVLSLKMPQPVADWKDPKAYPSGARVSLRRWAWEFLRRNASYQADWLAYAETCREIMPEWMPDKPLSDDPAEALRLHDLLHQNELFKVYDPVRLPGENEAAWAVRVGKGRIVPLDSWHGAKYGLQNFPSPFSDSFLIGAGPQFKAIPATVFVTKHWQGFKGAPTISDNRFRAIGIDLSLPIEPQLRDAQEALETAQARLVKSGAIEQWPVKRNRSREWPDLLRILDANAAGATPAEMAAEFFPDSANEYPEYLGQKAAEKRLKAAQVLAESGFRYIPMIRQ